MDFNKMRKQDFNNNNNVKEDVERVALNISQNTLCSQLSS